MLFHISVLFISVSWMLKHLFKNYSVLWLVKISNGQWLSQWPSFQSDAVGRGLAATCTLLLGQGSQDTPEALKAIIREASTTIKSICPNTVSEVTHVLNTHIKSLWLMWEEKPKHPCRMLLAVIYLNKRFQTVLKDLKIPPMKYTLIM